MSARITFNDLVKARSKLEQGSEHKTFKELESEQVTIKSGQIGGKSLDLATEYVKKTEQKIPVYGPPPTQMPPIVYPNTNTRNKTESFNTKSNHKPLGFINKSNFIRFVIPTTLGICVGSMLQQSVGTPVIFVLVFGILGITGAVMSS